METVITGLTTQPIVLRGEYSQSYAPGHHNLAEQFIFEPALEPDMSQQQLAELEQAGVRAIHVYGGSGSNVGLVHRNGRTINLEWPGDGAGEGQMGNVG